jgi:hypothetical protein
MKTIEPTPKAESTIKVWLNTHLAEELTDLDVIPTLAFNLPHGTGRASASELTSIKRVDLKELQLLSLSYSKVVATVKVTANVSMTVYWEDYLASQEVRELVGESEEFSSSSFDTDVDFVLKIEFELISEPPMVATHTVLSVEGDHGSCSYSA